MALPTVRPRCRRPSRASRSSSDARQRVGRLAGREDLLWIFAVAILGVAILPDTLAATDALAGGVTLFLGHEMRGLERGDRAWIDADDPRRLWVDWAGSSPGDQLRVVTGALPLM